MSSPIEVFEKIYDNRANINEIDTPYYHIAAAAYSAWLGSENVLEKNLALRLQKIAVDMIVDDIRYGYYSKTNHSEDRQEYIEYFRDSLKVYKPDIDNHLIQDAIRSIHKILPEY